MDKVFVQGLKVMCIVGILPKERITPQPLIIDLGLSIDYHALSLRVTEYVIRRKAPLLEELGVELCDLILKEFHPQRVSVRLVKPQAVENALGAGIEISKTADN